jgi:hypothetical protein
MRCRSGRHEWTDPADARRRCSGRWRREVRPRGLESDLDPAGRQSVRVGPYLFTHGWVLATSPTTRPSS